MSRSERETANEKKTMLAPLKASVCFGALMLAAGSNAAAQDETQDTNVEFEEVVVTGSYIKGTSKNAASPVEILDSAYIQSTGAISVGEIINKLSISSGAENQSDSFTQGATQGTANINLRGLGLSSTLVLINGKRMAISGARANDGSVFVDTNTFPVIAIERLEVLKEGAATTYGSDAVAGVANFILEKDFEGFQTRAHYSTTDQDSQNDASVGVMWGGGSDQTRFVVAAEYMKRTPLRASQRPELVDNAISTLGTTFLPFGNVTVADGDYAGSYTFLENVPDPNCEANDGILIPQASGARCGFFYGPRFNLVNKEERTTAYASLTHDFGESMQFSAEANWAKDEIQDNPQSPSYPILSFPLISPTHPGNPFGVPALWLGRPLGSAFESPNAPRDNKTLRLMGELSGTYNDETDWSISLTYSENEYNSDTPDIVNSRLIAALAGTGGTGGDQYFDPFNPTGNDPALIEWLKGSEQVSRKTDLLVLDAVVAGDLFEMSGGTVQYAAGVQWRREGYGVERNDLSITTRDSDGVLQPADLTFLGGGIEVDASRNAAAAFAEVLFPFGEALEITAALRYENLENDSSIDPKISARWMISDQLTLRASASTSFREPSLAQLFAADTSLQGIADTDPVTGALSTSTAFIRVTSNGSENLTPEQSENYNIGLIWNPTENFDIRLDYWKVDYSNVIQVESAQGKVIADRCGDDIIRSGDCATGSLVGIVSNLFNASFVKTDGLDLEMNWRIDAGGMGMLNARANVSHFLSYNIPDASGNAIDVVGLFNHDNFARSIPATKINASLNWEKGNHSASVVAYYVDDYTTTRPVPATEVQEIASWTTFDLQYGYSFELGDTAEANLTLGVKNVTDKAPPRVYDGVNLSYDPKQHDPRGRIFYLNASFGF